MNVYLHILAGYKYDLAEWLTGSGKSDKVFVPYLSYSCKEIEKEKLGEQIDFVPLEILTQPDFDEKLKIYELPPLETDFMEKALAYESMFINIASFKRAFPVGTYGECKRKYYNYLKYWLNFVRTNKIEFMAFDDIPHWMASYSAYIVAQILKIKVCILAPVGIRVPGIQGYIHVYGGCIEDIGRDILKDYNEIKKDCSIKIELEGLVKAYYDRAVNSNSEATIKPRDRKKWKKYVLDAKYSERNVYFPLARVLFYNTMNLGSAIFKHRTLEHYYRNHLGKSDLLYLRRLKLYRKYELMSLKEYDRQSIYPDKNKKYILFTPQIWPEATTIPQAGCFSEQYNSIQLLSAITKEYGVEIYVKEYYLQPYRERGFWKEIDNLENVKLIKSSVSSGELMENAIAVACQTGTSLIEAPFYGIPAISLGRGFCLKGMPGLFEVNSIQQGKKVVEEILSGINIDKEQLKIYYYAIQRNSVFFHRDPKGRTNSKSDEYKKTRNDLMTLFEKEIVAD